MYRVKGKSWIALGDPVGPKEEHQRLLWTFRKLCDRYGGWPAFYLVDGERLSSYVDLGLIPLKLGDDARVPLQSFSLQGAERAELREAHMRVLEQGVDFAIVNSPQVPALLPKLKLVSDDSAILILTETYPVVGFGGGRSKLCSMKSSKSSQLSKYK